MVDYKVLITTSGLGSRLGELTKYTNKCLLRISEKPSISYIIDLYPINTEFIITLGHYGSHVKQFLKLAYPKHNFEFVEIDNYMGEGSSLGFSISKCENLIKKPFIFHACDTILKDFTIPKIKNNFIVSCTKKNSSHYRTINFQNDKLIKINEKGELGFNQSYVGVVGIKDFELFFLKLNKILDSNNDISDTHVINEMINEVKFNVISLNENNWFDIGNVNEFIRTKKEFKTNIDILDKKDESIFLFDDFVIKFFHSSKTNNNRVIRGKNLSDLVPNILDYTENFYKYEKVKGILLSQNVNKNKFEKLLNWADKKLWIKKDSKNFDKLCYEFYITKTLNRIHEFLKKNDSVDNIEYINGEKIPSIFNLISLINIEWISNGISSKFHGDFILDNIIESKEDFKLIDWRQDFSENLEIGDLYYDLAKMNHNLTINHDIVNKNLFNHDADNCFILKNSILDECRDVLHKFITFKGYDLKKVNLLTSIIWINMSPLHEYPFNLFLFNFGKYNLYKNLKEINL